MYDDYLTFRSLTSAQRALAACQTQGIRAELVRAPKDLSAQGCGYALRMDGPDLDRAILELRLWGIPFERGYRMRPGGRVEEVLV